MIEILIGGNIVVNYSESPPPTGGMRHLAFHSPIKKAMVARDVILIFGNRIKVPWMHACWTRGISIFEDDAVTADRQNEPTHNVAIAYYCCSS